MSSHQPRHGAVSLVKQADAGRPARPRPLTPSPVRESEGALVVAFRWPVRVVALVIVVPLRMLWDALTAFGRLLRRTVWRPLVSAVAWLWHWLVVVPAGAVGVALLWSGKALFYWPWVGLWRYVLVPAGRGVVVAVSWLVRVLVVTPAAALYRWLLVPLGRALAVAGRETADAFLIAWRAAGRVSRAVFGVLGRVLRFLFVDPVVLVWRHLLRPLGRGLRDQLWRPAAGAFRQAGRAVRETVAAARTSVREARADLRRALFGAPRDDDRKTLR